MRDAISIPAAIVLGGSALVGGVALGIAAIEHVRASARGERMRPASGLSGPVDYLILAGAIFASVVSVPAAYEEWSTALRELSP